MLFTEFEWLCWDFSETKRTTTTKGYWLSKTGYSKKKTSRELQRSWKWFSYLHFLCIHQCCCALLWTYADDVCVCVCVFFYSCEAKRQRTIQVMDIHEIPKPKNTFFGKNKGGSGGGGGGSHGRHWWYQYGNIIHTKRVHEGDRKSPKPVVPRTLFFEVKKPKTITLFFFFLLFNYLINNKN